MGSRREKGISRTGAQTQERARTVFETRTDLKKNCLKKELFLTRNVNTRSPNKNADEKGKREGMHER